MITVTHVSKSFRKPVKQQGISGLFQRQYELKNAVDDISFTIEEGDIVGYIGPNGAGKSTTIKMLTGVLVPSAGTVQVNGLTPYRQRKQHAAQIGAVFGQKTQLWWDLPVQDSFQLLRAIYKIPEAVYLRNLAMFNEVLALEPFLHTPVRQLSLGQRMRADITAALLHSPPVVFLDEPTIGLDMIAREKLREFILMINHELHTTILLTTHDMQDIETLCNRIIVIDHGHIIHQSSMAEMQRIWGAWRKMMLTFASDTPPLDVSKLPVQAMAYTPRTQAFQFDPREISAAALVAHIEQQASDADMQILAPDTESMVRQIYRPA